MAPPAIVPIGKRNPNLAFHPAVRAGDFLFVSGQVPKDENGTMITGTIEEETAATLDAIRRVLIQGDADLEHVVKLTVYLADARNFGRYNGVCLRYFPDALISRTTVEARAVIETKIEIDAIAYKPLA